MLAISNDFTLPITRGYLDAVELPGGGMRLEPEAATIVDVRLGVVVASFLLMSAVAHIMISTVLYPRYVAYLKKGMNPYRWYEYSISASVMIVAIAMLVGIYDAGTLLLLFFVNATLVYMGLVMEQVNHGRKRVDWRPSSSAASPGRSSGSSSPSTSSVPAAATAGRQISSTGYS